MDMETDNLKLRRLVIEAKVPFVAGVFEKHGVHVDYLPARDITPEVMKDADALITRTRTRCDARLLAGSRCSMVATATIGTDHIDLDWCRDNGIATASAPGCNAPAVAQYVMACVLAHFGGDPTRLQGRRIGIIGVGHVGRIVDAWARSLGMTTLLCDPPRAEREGPEGFVEMDRIAREADVVTVHTPLTDAPQPWPTRHLLDEAFLGSLERQPLVINCARGPVASTEALIEAYRSGKASALAIDCWEGEPAISLELLACAMVATPHIAGYSRQGKMRASQMAVDAVTAHFGLPHIELPCGPAPVWPETVTAASILASYNPLADTAALKAAPEAFESLRDNYQLRNEPQCI